MWADVTDYVEYLKGRAPTVPPEEIAFWLHEAQDLINANNAYAVEFCAPSHQLRRATCKVAELLYQDARAPKAGDVISESNAGYSYALQKPEDQVDTVRRYRRLIVDMLSTAPANEWNALVSRAVM
ncbi:MAG: hypothetical protein FWC66_05200 [Oscillospiraceae bacterium]|nr:hypothetical protein [Oscillospiraceae bacterium]